MICRCATPAVTAAIVAFLFALAVPALSGETPAMVAAGPDPFLAWLQAAGFPTWAVVLLMVGRQVTQELKAISNRLESHVTQTERRLSRLEMIAVRHHSDAVPIDDRG